MGEDKASELLKNYVFWTGDTENLSGDLKISFIGNSDELGSLLSGGKVNFKYDMKRYNHNGFSMITFTDTHGILYWSDGFNRHWRAYLDGKEAPIYKANMNFKAVELTKGSHDLKFIFEFPLFKFAIYTFYISLFLSIITGGALFIFRKIEN